MEVIQAVWLKEKGDDWTIHVTWVRIRKSEMIWEMVQRIKAGALQYLVNQLKLAKDTLKVLRANVRRQDLIVLF